MYLFIFLSIYQLSTYQSIYLSIHLSIHLSIYLSIYLGLSGPASQYTWIFTSILSSEILIDIEQLLSRTKVCRFGCFQCLFIRLLSLLFNNTKLSFRLFAYFSACHFITYYLEVIHIFEVMKLWTGFPSSFLDQIIKPALSNPFFFTVACCSIYLCSVH